MKFDARGLRPARAHTSPSSTRSTPSSSTRRAPRSSSPAPPTRPPTSTTRVNQIIPNLEDGELIETLDDEDLDRRLRRRREGARHHRDRRGLGEDREAARHRQPLRPRELGPQASRRPVAMQGAQPLQARRRVRGQRGRGHHRRRVHRAPDAGPALVRRPAPGGRGQGGRARSARRDQTLATITFQNYFRMYKKLSGMTGTAETEAAEFDKIYKLDVVVIPTNRPMLRIDNRRRRLHAPRRRSTSPSSTRSRDLHEGQQPVLVGTTSHREVASCCRDILKRKRRPPRRAQRQAPREGGRDRRPGRAPGHGHHRHQHGRPRHRHPARRQPRVHGPPGPGQEVAGARRIAAEGDLANAGRHGASTTQARSSRPRRSWDAPSHAPRPREGARGVVAAGGLHILGTERHESRRIDNQLRGRAGRQGDPGIVALLPVASKTT